MPGLRIYHVNPRLAGPIENWSGLDEPGGKSPLLEHAREMNLNAIWFSPISRTSHLPVQRNGRTVSGSLYSATDHFHLSSDLSSGTTASDNRHLRHFTAQAAAANVKIIGDLVFNHVARDHPLVEKEDKEIERILKHADGPVLPIYDNESLIGMTYNGSKSFHFKFHRNADYSLAVTGTNDEVWDDVAKINYSSPEATEFFVTGKDGKQGYWKDVIDWHLDRGFTGFRCDVAYLVPAPVWSELIQHAHDKQHDVLFIAETLGDRGRANALADAEIMQNGQTRKAFDLGMLGFYWWDFKNEWMMKENKRIQKMSIFGGAGSPDSHDTENSIAGLFLTKLPDKAVSDICMRDYAVAALACNSVYMEMGYEYCRPQISVFKDKGLSAYWNSLQQERGGANHPLNLTSRIRAVNDFKEKLDEENALVRMDKISTAHHLVKIECTLVEQDTEDDLGNLVLYVNEKPEDGPVPIKKKEFAGKNLILGLESQDNDTCRIKDIAAFYTPAPAPKKSGPQP